MKKINFDLKCEFKKIVKKSRNKIAIDYGDEKKYDFNFLDLQSNKLISIFKIIKIENGDIIAIDSEKNINSFALIIACIKNGNPYSFVEIANYNYRLKNILKTLNPKVIFTFKKKLRNINECVLKEDLSYTFKLRKKLAPSNLW